MEEIIEKFWQLKQVNPVDGSCTNYFFVERPFGNTLVYGTQDRPYPDEFLGGKGGVARQLLYHLKDVDETHRRNFQKYGAAANLCIKSSWEFPFDEKLRFESLAENEYSDPELAGFSLGDESNCASIYLLRHNKRNILFSGDFIQLDQGQLVLGNEWKSQVNNKVSEKGKISQIIAQLSKLTIDVIAPKTFIGEFSYYIAPSAPELRSKLSQMGV